METVKENIISLTPDNFQAEVLECDRPVLVTFFALWDQPCRMQQSELDSIADKHPEIKVCKLDVEEYPDFAQQFGIMMVPTTIAFKNGKKISAEHGSVITNYQYKRMEILLHKNLLKKNGRSGGCVGGFFQRYSLLGNI